MKTRYEKVFTKDRLPEKKGDYLFCSMSNQYSISEFDPNDKKDTDAAKLYFKFWFEEIIEPTDEDIERASCEYTEQLDGDGIDPAVIAIVSYQAGAKDMRDGKINSK
jgi:hypothetical protein